METINTDDKTIIIRPLLESDWNAMNELCSRRFGNGYLDREDFSLRVRHPELNLVADWGGEAVAMVSMTPLGLRALADVEQMDYERLVSDAAGKEALRFRSAICHENFEGMGLIRLLLEKVIENGKKLGYGVILSTVWKYNGQIPMGKLHSELGFEDLGERHMLWYNQKGYTCVVCKGPCRCDGELFELIL